MGSTIRDRNDFTRGGGAKGSETPARLFGGGNLIRLPAPPLCCNQQLICWRLSFSGVVKKKLAVRAVLPLLQPPPPLASLNMFYSQFILAKKGPLGTIWIAAHLERKLRKNQITETNISASVDSILFPEVPIALRLSGHLLLGVVRIYSRKVNYLFHDCSEALVKIKHAFHSSAVDLPPESSTAPFHSITLPETFDFDELEVCLKRDKGIQTAIRGIVDHNVTARDLITLREQADAQAYRSSLFTLDERFPECGDPYSLLDSYDEQHVVEGIQICTGSASLMQENCGPSLEEDVLPPLQMDDEMDFERSNETEFDTAFQGTEATEQGATPSMQTNLKQPLIPDPGEEQLYSPSTDIHVAPTPMSVPDSVTQIPDVEKLRSAVEPQEQEPLFMGLDDEMGRKKDAVDGPELKESTAADLETHVVEATPVLKETPVSIRPSPLTVEAYGDLPGSDDLLATILGGRTPVLKMIETPEVVASANEKRGQRKRKAAFDDLVALSSIFMKKQLADTADLCRKRRRTPLTKFEARKTQGSYIDEKFTSPSCPGLCVDVRELYISVIRRSSSKPLVTSLPDTLGKVKTCDISGHGNRTAGFDAMEIADDMITPQVADSPPASAFQPDEANTAFQTPVNVQETQVTVPLQGEQGDFHAAEPLPNAASLQDISEQSLEDLTSLAEPKDRVNVQETQVTVPLQGAQADFQGALHAAEPLPNAASLEDISEQALEDLTFLAEPKDRVFLAADEEATLEETDISFHRKGKPVPDNSGWSLRTKAVAEYLKPLFERLESAPLLETGPAKLSLDSLLKRRSRKESARMFFEILVLKSKEYIHVDQSTAFADIMLSATHLLRKEVF